MSAPDIRATVHAALSSVQGTTHHLGLVTLQVLTDRVTEAVAPLVPDTTEAYPGQLAMLTGLVATLRAVATHGDLADVRKLLDEHQRDEQDAYTETEKSSPTRADATPDFFQPGHTYADDEYGWKFRVDTITTHPEDGERTALGWRYFNGRWAEMAYGEDDWETHQLVGHTDVTAAVTE